MMVMVAWNKGLTKETDERVDRLSKKLNKKFQGKFVEYHPWDWRGKSIEQYQKERETAVEKSDYKGTELVVITNLEELR